MISGIGLLNSHTLPQENKLSKLNVMNMSVENGDVNDDYCDMNRFTGSHIKNHNSVHYTNKRDETSTNRYLSVNNELLDGVDIKKYVTCIHT